MVIAALLRRLGEILVQERLTTPDVVEQALARAKTTSSLLTSSLVELGAVKSEDVLRALAEQQNLAYLSRDELPSPLPVVKTLSAKYLRQYTVCPVSIENGLLTVAIADPLNAVVLDDLRQFTGLAVKLVVSSAEAITEAIDRTYDGAATPLQRIVEGIEDESAGAGEEDVNHLRDMAFEAPVMRLLDRSSVFLPMEKLGFAPGTLRRFEALIKRPHGILLVTGPTGSGKTTTLYGALDKINTPDRKIITVEDPVEYQLKGVNQIHVKPKIGLTFATGLRHIVRQDPDVILIGEIRDLETAEIAIQAALTGHLVFSTLHTNDAPGAITRLQDMGVEPYLVASVLEGVRERDDCRGNPSRHPGRRLARDARLCVSGSRPTGPDHRRRDGGARRARCRRAAPEGRLLPDPRGSARRARGLAGVRRLLARQPARPARVYAAARDPGRGGAPARPRAGDPGGARLHAAGEGDRHRPAQQRARRLPAQRGARPAPPPPVLPPLHQHGPGG